MKMENLHRTTKEKKDEENDDESDESDDDDDESDKNPELETAMIKHNGSVNRIRVRKFGQNFIIFV